MQWLLVLIGWIAVTESAGVCSDVACDPGEKNIGGSCVTCDRPTCCLPHTGCKGLTQSDVGVSIEVPSGCGSGMTGFCDYNTDAVACGQQALSPARICKVQCANGYVCRDSAGSASCLSDPIASDGWLNKKPSSTDNTQLSFLYFCLCGADCWDSNRAFTAYTTSPCVPATPTETATATVPTVTETFSETQTDSVTLTLPTVTPSEPDPTDVTTSALACAPHQAQRYLTGRSITCTFTANDRTGRLVTGDGRKVVATVFSAFTGGSVISTVTATQQDPTLGIYTVTLPPIASEGSYLVSASLTSEEWSGFEVKLTAALPVNVGDALGLTLSCLRKLANGTTVADDVFVGCLGSSVTSQGAVDVPTVPPTNWLYVGSSLQCDVVPTAPGCTNCRLTLPMTVYFASSFWSTDTKLVTTSAGTASTTSPTPILYRFSVTSDLLEERVLKFKAVVGGSLNFITTKVDSSQTGLLEYAFRYGEVTGGNVVCADLKTMSAAEEDEDVRQCYVEAVDSCQLAVLPSLETAATDYTISVTYSSRNDSAVDSFALLNRTNTYRNMIPVTTVPLSAVSWGKGELHIHQSSLELTSSPYPPLSSYLKPSNKSTIQCNRDTMYQGEPATCIVTLLDEWGNPVPSVARDLVPSDSSGLLQWSAFVGTPLHIDDYAGEVAAFKFSFTLSFPPQSSTFDTTKAEFQLALKSGVSVVTHSLTLSPFVDPVLEFYVNGGLVKNDVTLAKGDYALSVVIAGAGTSSASFLQTKKTYAWKCSGVTSTKASFTFPAASIPAGGSITCTLAINYNSDSRQGTFSITVNTFDTPGVISVDKNTFTTTEEVLKATCSGFSDSHTPLKYYIADVTSTSVISEAVGLSPVTESTVMDLSAPRLSLTSYVIKVACIATDSKNGTALSTNTVDLTVPAWTPPSTAAQQDAYVVSLITALSTASSSTLSSLTRSSQALTHLSASTPSARVEAAKQVASALTSSISSTTSLQISQTSLIASAASDLFTTINSENVQTVPQTTREAAHEQIANVLKIVKVGDTMNSAGRTAFGDALGGLFTGLTAGAKKREAKVLLAQASGAQMVTTALNLICTIGVSTVLNSPFGTCGTHSKTGVYQLQACSTDVNGAETTASVAGGSGSLVFEKVDDISSPVAKGTQVVQVVALLEGSPFGFDPTSKPLLGPPSMVCLYDMSSQKYLTASSTLMNWTLPVTPISDPGYSFSFDSPKGAIYTSSGWITTSCTSQVASNLPSPVSSFDVQCSGISDTTPTVVAVAATRDVCSSSFTKGCIATNGLRVGCMCTQCGSGYIAAPINNGLACQPNVQYRCNSQSGTVLQASQCIGNSFLQGGKCTCASGFTCRGGAGPGVCIADKKCDNIGKEYECVESGLMHDGSNQKCLCPPVNGNVNVFCNSGTCELLRGCGSQGSALSCGYNSVFNSTTGTCTCQASHFCDTNVAVHTCQERAKCGLHPMGNTGSTCLGGLEYDATASGISKGSTTRLSFVLTAVSTSPVQPVTDDGDVSALRTTVSTGLASKVLGEPVGAPVLRREVPTVERTQSTFISFVLQKHISTLSSSTTLLTEVLNAFGITLGTATRCTHVKDVDRLLCIYSSSPLELFIEDEMLDGSCVCPNQIQCNGANSCTCPVCKNGGVCEWPANGVDNHNCTCLTDWKGEDCSLREAVNDRFIDVTFPHASFAVYEELPKAEQDALVAKADEVLRSLMGTAPPSFKVFIHSGSLVVSYLFTLPQSTFDKHLKNIPLSTLANTLSRQLAISTPLVMASATHVPISEVCPRVAGCDGVPVHWSSPKCECLACEAGMMRNPKTGHTTCVADTLCDASACSFHGVPDGFVELGCSCVCSKHFSNVAGSPQFCGHDECLDNVTEWQKSSCGGERCGNRYDHHTVPGANIGECLMPDNYEFGITQVVALVIAGFLCVCLGSCSYYYASNRHCPWESAGPAYEKSPSEGDETEMADVVGSEGRLAV